MDTLALRVDLLRLSSTSEKPCNTSLDTLRASIAIRTTYMRFIIFWRGDILFFFIGIVLLLVLTYADTSSTHTAVEDAPPMFTVRAFIIREYTLLSSSIC